MDKETLSNYGWIVICVLVLSVMIALATPFGTYIEQGVWSATEGLFDTNNSAMGTVVTYSITDGAGKTINPTTATELIFRANMDISKFKGVKIDGTTVDKANYTASDNTVISFTTDYIRTISLGTHTIEILADIGSAKAEFKAADGWEVPEGGTYTAADGTIYNAGEFVRYFPNDNHVFVYGDYEYRYQTVNGGGWNVIALDKTKNEYGAILESVNRRPVTRMEETFRGCTVLTIAPTIPNGVTNMKYTFYGCTSFEDLSNMVIPNSVTNMYGTFYNCTSLTKLPTIPNSATNISCLFKNCTAISDLSEFIIPNNVTSLYDTFSGCTSLTDISNLTIPNGITNMLCTFNRCTKLTTAPTIPSSVTNMDSTFSQCTSLTGDIEINATPTSYYHCLDGTKLPIHIIGSCGNKSALATTATRNNVTY